jgi:very-short-patch-repair endonuclease
MVANLVAGENGYVSHTTAAALFELSGISPGVVEISTNRRLRTFEGAAVHRVVTPPAMDTTRLGPFVVSAVPRTLIDLAATQSRERVEGALDDALRRRLTTFARVRWRLDALGARGLRGSALLRELLEERDPIVPRLESALEDRFLSLLRGAHLPIPVAQHVIKDGRFVARVDFAYPEEKIVVEVDGYRYHSGKTRWERDLSRRNRLESLGWRVLNVTWRQIQRHPTDVISLMRRVLPSQGSLDV